MPDLEDDIAAGRPAALVDWLRTNVHGRGSLQTAEELMTVATGEPLNPKIFLDHLTHRYLGDG
jgi:carboxypeptidase Taq